MAAGPGPGRSAIALLRHSRWPHLVHEMRGVPAPAVAGAARHPLWWPSPSRAEGEWWSWSGAEPARSGGASRAGRSAGRERTRAAAPGSRALSLPASPLPATGSGPGGGGRRGAGCGRRGLARGGRHGPSVSTPPGAGGPATGTGVASGGSQPSTATAPSLESGNSAGAGFPRARGGRRVAPVQSMPSASAPAAAVTVPVAPACWGGGATLR